MRVCYFLDSVVFYILLLSLGGFIYIQEFFKGDISGFIHVQISVPVSFSFSPSLLLFIIFIVFLRGIRWHGATYCVGGQFFFLLFYAMRRGTVRWISIAYPIATTICLFILGLISVIHIRFQMAWAVASFFYGDCSLD